MHKWWNYHKRPKRSNETAVPEATEWLGSLREVTSKGISRHKPQRHFARRGVLALSAASVLVSLLTPVLSSSPVSAADTYDAKSCTSTKNGDRPENGQLGNQETSLSNGAYFVPGNTGTHCFFSEQTSGPFTAVSKYNQDTCTAAGGEWVYYSANFTGHGCSFKLAAAEANQNQAAQTACKKQFPDSQVTLEGQISSVVASPGYNTCIEGSQNKANKTYCDKYTDKNGDQYKGCIFGQTGAVPSSTGSSDTPVETTSTCAINGIGWLICPIMTALGNVADGMYDVLEGFLAVQPSMFNADGAAYKTYQKMLPIANIILAVLFLVIIYSTATGNGFGAMSNFDVKKTLPRLIIFAVLINISWYICAAAVDVSNIVGSSVRSLFEGFTPPAPPSINAGNSGQGWGGIISVALVAGGAFIAGPAAIGLLLLAVVVVILMMFLILVVRQAGVILLCVIAPFAFAMGMLPNTQSLFKKWWKAFSSLLLVYPIIGIIYGASYLAGTVLTDQTNIDMASFPTNGTDLSTFLLGVAGEAVKVLPLFAVPMVLKGSLKGLGAVGAAVGGFAAGRMKSSGGRARNRAKEGYQMSRLGQGINSMKASRKRKKQMDYATGVSRAASGRFGRLKGMAYGINPLARKVTRRGALSGAAQIAATADEQAIKEEGALVGFEMLHAPLDVGSYSDDDIIAADLLDDNERQTLQTDGKAAAIQQFRARKKGVMGDIDILSIKAMQAAREGNSDRVKAIEDNLATSKGAPGVDQLAKTHVAIEDHLRSHGHADVIVSLRRNLSGKTKPKNAALDRLSITNDTDVTLAEAYHQTPSGIGRTELATQTKATLEHYLKEIQAGGYTPVQLRNLDTEINAVFSDSNLHASLAGNGTEETMQELRRAITKASSQNGNSDRPEQGSPPAASPPTPPTGNGSPTGNGATPPNSPPPFNPNTNSPGDNW